MVGHTHEDIDRMFGLNSRTIWRKDLKTVSTLCTGIESTSMELTNF